MIWALAAVGLAAALAYQGLLGAPKSGSRSAIKTGATAALALASLVAGGPWLLVLALALGALGDFFLSRPGQGAFLKGLVAFALSHLAYIALFTGLPGWGDTSDPGWAVYAGLIGLALLAPSTARWLLPYTGRLRGPVIAYVLVITAMGAAALLLAPAFRLALLGAAMFLASDVILSVQIFRLAPGTPAHRNAGQAVWPLYWGGQALIAYGVIGRLAI